MILNAIYFLKAKIKYSIQIRKTKFVGKNIYLINTPEHGNLGDHMIAYASIDFIRKNFPNYNVIEITHDQWLYSKKYIKKKINNNELIIITGGGYLGDLWENEQKVFCDIVETFNKNNIICFPQTIHFQDKSKIEYYKKKFNSYDNLKLVVRENNSYEFILDNEFVKKENLIFTPDIVLSYPQYDYQSERKGILFCARSDKEKNIGFDDIIEIAKSVSDKVDFTDTVVDYYITIGMRKNELEKKFKQFSQYELIITDRLHGMIFAYLTKTPCIAFDNVSKKVSGVYKWIDQSDSIICINEINSNDFKKMLEDMLSKKEKDFYICNHEFDVLSDLMKKNN